MKNNNPRKTPTANKPQSSQDLCEKLKNLSQQKTWNKSTIENFIFLIINPEQQYQLNDNQKKSLIESLKNCPKNAQSFVHLSLILENFMSSSRIRTLDDVIPEIAEYLKKEKLKLEYRDKEELHESQFEDLIGWFRKELKSQKKEKEKKDF